MMGSGYVYVAIWRNMGDGRVRPQIRRHTKKGWVTSLGKNGADHMKMDGMTVLAGEKFTLTDDGAHAKAPGQSGKAHHDCNCRCFLEYDIMTVEEFEQKTGRKLDEKYYKKEFTNGDDSGKITMIKLTPDNKVAVPMDAEHYKRMKTQLEKHGCRVTAAKDDDERFLLYLNAEAISDECGIIHLGDTPSASAFFEEIIHQTQIQKYGSVTSDDFVERAAREVAANRKLLKHGKAYGFTEEDFDDISKNLSLWENDFLRRVGVPYDESGIKREI